jgi:hypothetical protein
MFAYWFVVGGLSSTFISSRLLLLVTAPWTSGGYNRLVVCHSWSLLFAALFGSLLETDTNWFPLTTAAMLYFPGQLLWLAVDAWRLKRRMELPSQNSL